MSIANIFGGSFMADNKEKGIITEKREREVPRTVSETRTVQEPKTVMEKKTIEVPKTVMEERQIQQEKVIMERQTWERLVSASCKSLDGWEIVNAQGEKLGTFNDVMLDLQSGRIAYAVISAGGGGLFGGKKMIAVPWEALSIERAEISADEDLPKRMVLDVSKDTLDNAPSFDKDNWPMHPDRSWLNKNLYSPYGYRPYWDRTGDYRQSGRDNPDI
jgi:sporulation protein YlmC with PRC-barrel domain